MSKLNWLIIGIPVLILIILAVVLLVTSSQDSNYVNKNEDSRLFQQSKLRR